MTASPAAMWINSFFADFDLAITAAIHRLYEIGGGFFTPFFEFISLLGKGGIFLLLVALLLTLNKPTRRYGTAMFIALSIGVILTNCCLKVLIARPRPYADENSLYYQLWQLVGMNTESDKSFPSGHTTAAFAACVPLFLLGNKRISWAALLFGIAMGVARIYLVVHFPTDVIAGMIVGTLAGILAVIISAKLPAKWYDINFFRRKAVAE